MKLKYTLDISDESTWFVHTPNDIARKLPFYINEYGHYMAYPDYYTERQHQKNYLVIYTLSGEGLLHYWGKDYILRPNEAVLIYCEPYHLYRTAPGNRWDFMWFHCNGTSAEAYFNLLNQEFLSVVAIREPSQFRKMLDDLFCAFTVNDIAAHVNVSMITTNILSHVLISRFTPEQNRKHEKHHSDIQKVIRYIQSHYTCSMDMEQLAQIACMSKHYFIRVFKGYMGVSPYDFLINYRINKAKVLLKTTEYSVGEICSLVGFNDYSHFIRQFGKVVGITPLKYRIV